MSSYNLDTLIQNINSLMSSRNITQAQLAKVLHMSQPNVSKALNRKDKKCFTLEQVIAIANSFDVSIDSLFGTDHVTSQEIGPRMVASLISKLIINNEAALQTIDVKEAYYPFGEEPFQYNGVHAVPALESRIVSYPVVYFPNYKKADTSDGISLAYKSEDPENEARMKPVNDYLPRFIKFYKASQDADLDMDAFMTAVDSFLSKLPE